MNAEYTQLMQNPLFTEGLALFQQAKTEKSKDDKRDSPRYVVSMWLRKYRDSNGCALNDENVMVCLNKIADCDAEIEAKKAATSNGTNNHSMPQEVAAARAVTLGAPAPQGSPQPYAEQIARKFIGFGGHVIFFPRGTKRCLVNGWEQLATNNNLEKALAWASQDPCANVGLVGKQNGLWALDVDDPAIQAELGRLELQHGSIGTYRTRTVSGGQHLIFRQSAASWEMGNVSVTDENKAELLSARVNDRYVVLAGSWAHPHNDTSLPLAQYTAIDPDAPVVEAPQWVLDFIKAKHEQTQVQKGRKTLEPVADSSVVKGGRNNYLTTVAGKMRQHFGWGYEKLKLELLLENEKKCSPPLPESEVDSIARSISGYEVVPGDIILNQKSASSAKPDAPVIEQDEIEFIAYPKFPRWVMANTSVYENLVKPICEKNSRYPEFMWLPAMALILNYTGLKVRVEMRSDRSSIFLIVIGTKGRTIKSSSIETVLDYFRLVGCLGYSKGADAAEGRTLVWTAGSTEGFGIEMTQKKCKNGLLFYDEFKLLSDKANIESSSLKSHLLTIYEQGLFANSTKKKSEKFQLEPNTYVGTLFACTTPKNFHDLWSTFAYGAEGMDDRFFFLLEPEVLDEPTPEIKVDFIEGSIKTRRRIDQAINKGTLRMTQGAAQILADSIKKLGNRPSQRAEKWARAIAIDLGLDIVNEDAVRRGIAITEYELTVKKYLDVRGANSKLAAAQLKLCQILQRQPGGRMPYNGKNGLYARMRGDSYDTKTWWSIYNGLAQAGRIRVDGRGTKEDPYYVTLVRALTEEE